MLSLKIPVEPYWIDLGYGIRVKVRPQTTTLMYEAQARARRVLAQGGDPTDGERVSVLLTALAQAAVWEWEGVTDDETGGLAPVNDDNIAMMMSFFPLADRFNSAYNGQQELLHAEKKPHENTSVGTTAVEQTTAEPA